MLSRLYTYNLCKVWSYFFTQFCGFGQQQMAPSFAQGCIYQITHLLRAFYANVIFGCVAVLLPSNIHHLLDSIYLKQMHI